MISQIANAQPQQAQYAPAADGNPSQTQPADVFQALLQQIYTQSRTQDAGGKAQTDRPVEDKTSGRDKDRDKEAQEGVLPQSLAAAIGLQGTPSFPGMPADSPSFLQNSGAVSTVSGMTANLTLPVQSDLEKSGGLLQPVQNEVPASSTVQIPLEKTAATENIPLAAAAAEKEGTDSAAQTAAQSNALPMSQTDASESVRKASNRSEAEKEEGVSAKQQLSLNDAAHPSEDNASVVPDPATDSATVLTAESGKSQASGNPGETGEHSENPDSSRQGKPSEKQNDLALAQSAPDSGLYESGKVVVKVSDAGAKGKAALSRQISGAVVSQLQNGKNEFQMELSPQSLGKVSVKLVSENGMLTIEIAAANPKTQSLLLSSSGDIQSILHSATGQPVTVTGADQPPSWQDQPRHGGSGYYPQDQQQQPQQQQRKNDFWNGNSDSSYTTGDFLTLMKLKAVGL